MWATEEVWSQVYGSLLTARQLFQRGKELTYSLNLVTLASIMCINIFFVASQAILQVTCNFTMLTAPHSITFIAPL